tara:strand:- start:1998 stop:2255 length:258 start_codon:yes stop_codon:yes gene_type:complete
MDKITIKLFFNEVYNDVISVLFKQMSIHKETEGTNPKPIGSNAKFTAYEDFEIKKGETYDISLWGQFDEDKGYQSANIQIKKAKE